MSHIRIKNEFYRTPEYLKFLDLRKSKVYYFLLAAIIRESAEVKRNYHGAHYIYQQHFLKGQLVSRYSQKKMAELLGTSQSRISKYLIELEKDGFIKKIVRPTQKGNILYYQFGTWEGTFGEKTYKETIWLDEHFTRCYEDAQKAKEKTRKTEALVCLMEPYDTWFDYQMGMIKKGLMDITDEDKLEQRFQYQKSIWDEIKGEPECLI